MKATISKGSIIIEGTTAEEKRIEEVAANMMDIDSGISVVSGGDEHGEYWTHLTYDSRYQVIEEIKETYRAAKAA